MAELAAAGHEVLTTTVPWDDEDESVRTLVAEVGRFAQLRAGRPWALAWCAGAGVVATGEEALAAEVRVFERVTGALAASVTAGEDGVVFLASSAGGLYAGSTPAPFDERTSPRPLVAYGRAKLAMEAAVERLAEATGVRAVLGRLSNVYGPGQTLAKPQGLLSQLCLADATGRPLPVFVSMDTIRDYLYAEDAARMVVRSHRPRPPGAAGHGGDQGAGIGPPRDRRLPRGRGAAGVPPPVAHHPGRRRRGRAGARPAPGVDGVARGRRARCDSTAGGAGSNLRRRAGQGRVRRPLDG